MTHFGLGMIKQAIALDATVTFTDTTANTVNQSVYSFTTQAFGAADATRVIVVGIAHGGTTTAVSWVTIGGVSATKAVSALENECHAAIWYAEVPTGTSGTVVVGVVGGAGSCAIVVWSVLNASSTPTATGSSVANPPSTTISCAAGGVIIGFNQNSPSSNKATTWTNLTEVADATLEGDRTYSGASDAFETAHVSRAVTATLDGGVENFASMVVASWSP